MTGNRGKADELFSDDFNGPALNPVWQASLPNPAPLGVYSATYLGAPNYSFQTVDGSTVLRLSNSQSYLTRVGLSTSTAFTPRSFVLDSRFNTLDQSPSTGIDGMIELSLINAANPAQIDIVRLFGSSFDANPQFQADSSIDNSSQNNGFNYQNDTWYHLELSGSLTQDIAATLLSDNGTVLDSFAFDHTLSAFPGGFQIGISQVMGLPTTPYPLDVAVDYVRLTATPEPASFVTFGIGAAGLFATVRCRRWQTSPRRGRKYFPK